MNLYDYYKLNGIEGLQGKEFYITMYEYREKNPLKNLAGIVRPTKILFDKDLSSVDKITDEMWIYNLQGHFHTLKKYINYSGDPLLYNSNAHKAVDVFENYHECFTCYSDLRVAHVNRLQKEKDILWQDYWKELMLLLGEKEEEEKNNNEIE